MSNSGVIGGKKTPSTSSAGGVHTSQEIYTELTADTFPTPYQITMTNIPSSVDEDAGSFTVSVADSSGTTYSLPYLLDNVYGNIEPADFSTAVTGNISMVAGVGTLVITLAEDGVTENEYFRIVTRHPVTNAYNFISAQINITDTDLPSWGSHRYWGIQNYGLQSGNSYIPVLKDARFYTGENQTGTEYPPDMTSASTPSPYQIWRSYANSSTYEGWKAFDNNTGTYWYLSNSNNSLPVEYIYADMGTAKTIASAHFIFYSTVYTPASFDVKYSDNAVDWYIAYSVTGNTSATVNVSQ
jgi:hypothetical protein